MNHTVSQMNSRRRRFKKLFRSIAVAAAVLAAGLVVFVFLFSDMLLNRYAKGKIEKAFADAYPGYALQIGSIHYSIFKNATECRLVSLAADDSSLRCSAGSFSVSEIGWKQLVSQQGITPEVVKRSTLTANDIMLQLPMLGETIRCGSIRISVPDSEIVAHAASMDFVRSRYVIRCGIMRISAPDSEFSAEGIEFRPRAGDDDFYSASAFRRMRVALKIGQCYLRHAPVLSLLRDRSHHAGMLEIVHPEIELLVNREKPSDPKSPKPLMPAEALARIGRTLRLDTLAVRDGRLEYGERLDAKGKPGIITFDSVRISAFDIGNTPGDTITIRGRGRFMKAGVMSVLMKIPMSPRAFSLSYSGSLTAMDATTLNRFLEIAEHARIKSGMIHEASFDVHVARDRGSGKLKILYDNLYVTLLDEQSGSKNVLGKQLETIFANLMKIRGSNMPDKSGSLKIGDVKYARDPTDTFMNITWFSLRSALGDVVGF